MPLRRLSRFRLETRRFPPANLPPLLAFGGMSYHPPIARAQAALPVGTQEMQVHPRDYRLRGKNLASSGSKRGLVPAYFSEPGNWAVIHGTATAKVPDTKEHSQSAAHDDISHTPSEAIAQTMSIRGVVRAVSSQVSPCTSDEGRPTPLGIDILATCAARGCRAKSLGWERAMWPDKANAKKRGRLLFAEKMHAQNPSAEL